MLMYTFLFPLLLLIAFEEVVPAPLYLTIGPRSLDRQGGIWPSNVPYNGTGPDSPLQPYSTHSFPKDLLWCSKLQIPAPGMIIMEFGLFTATAGTHMKLYLYDDSERGYPVGGPLVNRSFTSVFGQNNFNFSTSEYTTWSIPRGGSDFVWLCIVHDNPANATFFTIPGSIYEGPSIAWPYSLATAYIDWADYAPNASFLQVRTNVYIYGPSLVTGTPTLTASHLSVTSTLTRSPTAIQTLSPTVTATSSASTTASGTHTSTATAVPTYDPQHYVYNGIPAPMEVLTIPWVDFYPFEALVGEEVTVRVEGFHNFWEHDIFFKVGRGVGYNDCYGVQPGSTVQKLTNNTIKLRALRADSYRVCYKLRNDWEPLERRFNVRAVPQTDVFGGYNSCQQYLLSNSTLCGCFLGTTGGQVLLPSDFPLNLLLPRALEKTMEMGCCQDRASRRVLVGTGQRDWGWCAVP